MDGLNLEGAFPINLDKGSSESTGIDELITNYRNSLTKIKFKQDLVLSPTLRAIQKCINKQ